MKTHIKLNEEAVRLIKNQFKDFNVRVYDSELKTEVSDVGIYGTLTIQFSCKEK